VAVDQFSFDRRGNLEVLTWPLLDGAGVRAVVTTRGGGVSAGSYESLNLGLHVGDRDDLVVENRRRAAAAVGLDLADLVFCNQAHGRHVVIVDRKERGRGSLALGDAIPEADALVTVTPAVGLVVMVADCVPIVLLEPERGVLACIHAGWRGTVARVAEAAVEVMVSLGARADRVAGGLGPAISPVRYQVGDDVVDQARQGLGASADDVVRPDGTGRWLFDLWEANRQVLVEAGVPAANLAVAAVGTGRGSPFFSHREERPCGRFAAIAALPA
jgi:YfiH family protein